MNTGVGHSAAAFYFDFNQQLKCSPPFIAGVSSIIIELSYSLFKSKSQISLWQIAEYY